MMNSKHSSIRVLGQRSIPSTFIHRYSNDHQPIDRTENAEISRTGNKHPRISLSDFLNRKLNKTSDPSKSVQGKEIPFLSPERGAGASQSVEGANANKGSGEAELNCVPDVVFERFKHRKENQDSDSLNQEDKVKSSMHEAERDNQLHDSRKRRNLFGEGADCKPPAPKGLVVLGDDPTPKRTRYHKSSVRNKKTLPIYNHYANGSGWWDSDMEGIDNEAVGFNEVWEGLSSSTLGGIDWH